MHDVLQQAMYHFATQSGAAKALTVFCASYLVWVMLLAWLGAAVASRDRFTLALIVRIVALVALSFVVGLALKHVVIDPRPYKVDGEVPLTTVSNDNGFPSDHTLMAAAMTASLLWYNRRLLLPFAALTLFVMLGRMGIAAHHSIDVLGSVVIVAVVAAVLTVIPLPASWDRPLLASAGAQPQALPRSGARTR